jgi:hypothetical protein
MRKTCLPGVNAEVKLVISVEDIPINAHRVHEGTFVQISPDHSRMDGCHRDVAVIV